MQLSWYCKEIHLPDYPDHSLLFSTRSGAMAMVDNEFIDAIKQGRADKELCETLAANDLLVENTKKERDEVFNYLEEINRLNPTFRLAVILGLECNFACAYCYEGSMKGKHAMTDKTAEQLVSFVEKNCAAGKEKITVSFYGGEPLLYRKRIISLSAKLQQVARSKGAEYQFNLVSNGSLLKRKVVEELLPFGLKSAKITLDGPPSQHNQTRPFISGQPSFTKIIANVRDCADLIKINIGGNFSQQSYPAFPELLVLLKQAGLDADKINQITFSAVVKPTDDVISAEFGGGCLSSDEKWLAGASIMLRQEILDHGYATRPLQPAPCRVNIADNLTIHYDGTICKCPVMIGRKECQIGTLASGIESDMSSYHLDHWQKEEKCRTCTYLPLCFGGCRYLAFQRNESMSKVDCPKAFFDATLESFIKQEVACLS